MTQAAYHIKIRNHLLGPAAISSDFQQLFESTGKYRAHNVESKMHHASRMTIIWINRVRRYAILAIR